MKTEVLLTEAEIAEEFSESIEARDLPEKFFYWTPLSVNAWKALSAASESTLRDTWAGLASRAADLTKPFGRRVPVISLGAGEGLKDRLLLKALTDAGREVFYFPVDASQTLLETACAGAEDDDCEAMGIKADISSPMHLVLASDVSEAPRLFLMVGNTLGGFDPLDQIQHVAGCVHKGDILIVDAHLKSGVQAEPTPEQKNFAFAPLLSAGLSLEDGDLEFAERPDDRLDGLLMVTRRFQASRDVRMTTSGRQVDMVRGERVLLNFQYLFSKESFRWLLTEHAGLRVVAEIPSGDGRFVTCVCIQG